MKTIIFYPKKLSIEYHYLENDNLIYKNEISTGNYQKKTNNLYSILDQFNEYHKKNEKEMSIDNIIIHSIYGGKEFKTSVVKISNLMLRKYAKVLVDSPIQVNLILELIKACLKKFTNKSIYIIFETAFFQKLPVYESNYAMDFNLKANISLIRTGYNGLFHESAMSLIQKETTKDNIKIISICLNKNPEIAGIINNKPVFITSGSTPMEGLPGEKKSGKLDPGIIIKFCSEYKWGPEQINNLLLNKSGIYGLLNKNVTFRELYKKNHEDKDYKLAKKIFEYQILLECGAAAGVMNGVDYIVFSGLYNDIGKAISNNLFKKSLFNDNKVKIKFLNKTLDEIIINKLNNQMLNN